MVEDGLEPGLLHQTELDPVPVPREQRARLQRRHRHLQQGTCLTTARVSPPCHHVPRAACAHLEDLVRGDAEPLGRVQELVLGDEVEGAASLGHQQSAGGGQQLPIVLWAMVVLVMRPSNVSNAV